MDTVTTAPICHHTWLCLSTTRQTDFLDLTPQLERAVAVAGVRNGLLNVQTLHTTTAIVVNEDEPLLLDDFREVLERTIPRAAAYRHDDLARRGQVPADEPRNGHAHCRALLLPVSATLNVVAGRLILGRWQKVFLVELDGPRRREVSVSVTGAAQ